MSTHYHPDHGHMTIPGRLFQEPPEGSTPRPVVDPNTHAVLHLTSGYEVQALPVDLRISTANEKAESYIAERLSPLRLAVIAAQIADPFISSVRRAELQAVVDWAANILGDADAYAATVREGQPLTEPDPADRGEPPADSVSVRG